MRPAWELYCPASLSGDCVTESRHQINHDSPSSIRQFLRTRGLAPRKRWGQNFLINPALRRRIIKLLDIHRGAAVWEIGPGLGAMSRELLENGADLTVFEIDPEYCRWLRESLAASGLKIIPGDIIETWNREWERRMPDRVLGNLPYNAASAVIASFIETGCLAPRSVFTVQDEMGLRMIAKPNTKAYSSFSVLCQTAARITDGGRAAPGSFYPAPRVRSRVVMLEPAELWGEIRNPERLRLLVRAMFASRRKTLRNNLKAAASQLRFANLEKVEQVLIENGINPSRRAETVSPGEWTALANTL